MSKNLLLGILGMFLTGGMGARAELEVSASVQIHAAADFHAPLAPHGTWIEVGSHGRCWRPTHVAVGWRPYCSGSWVWTDTGWYWASDEPWAWACYHYGRWVHDSHSGWVWVPDVEWAPAWVSWRVSASHIGWAPLPPAGWISVRVAAPSLFVFVGTGHFTDPIHPSKVLVNNSVILKQTKELNNISRENRNFGAGGPQKVVVNHGPQVSMIEKASGKSLKPVSIREAAGRTRVPPEVARSNKGAGDRGPKAAGNAEHQGGKEARAGTGGGPDKDGWESKRENSPPDRGVSHNREGGWSDRGTSPDREGGGRGGPFGGSGGGGGGGGKGGHGKGR